MFQGFLVFSLHRHMVPFISTKSIGFNMFLTIPNKRYHPLHLICWFWQSKFIINLINVSFCFGSDSATSNVSAASPVSLITGCPASDDKRPFRCKKSINKYAPLRLFPWKAIEPLSELMPLHVEAQRHFV